MSVNKPGVWLITVLIVLLGAVLFFTLGRADRQRRNVVERVSIGDRAERATSVIGSEPAICASVSLDHLAGSFPEGWAQAAIDVALESLEGETAERWVYALDRGVTPTCDLAGERTEIGVAANGTVVWLLPVSGRSSIELPPTLSPSGAPVAN